jgi:hypothetical protein
VLIDEAKGTKGNPWGISFARLFDMSNDSGFFRTAAQLRSQGYQRDGMDWVVERGVVPRQEALNLAGGRDAHSLNLQGAEPLAQPERYEPDLKLVDRPRGA